jgi:hypothetical protein
MFVPTCLPSYNLHGLPQQPKQNLGDLQTIMPCLWGKSQLGQICGHMGQQGKKGMEVGIKNQVEMDP